MAQNNSNSGKQSKAGGKIILVLLVIIAILALIVFLFDPFGFGIGGILKNGGNNGQGTQTSASESGVTDVSSVTAPPADSNQAYADVSVRGSVYLFGTEESTIENIISTITDYTKSSGESVIVKIFDDNATQNAMDDLTTALSDKGIKYIMPD